MIWMHSYFLLILLLLSLLLAFQCVYFQHQIVPENLTIDYYRIIHIRLSKVEKFEINVLRVI